MHYYIALWLLLIGLYGVATSRHLIHLITCLAVVQSSTYLALIAAPAVDPVVHAMVLTDLVVGAATFALLLSLAVKANQRHQSADPEKLRP